MLDLDVIDAHHHLQDLSLGYPWLQVDVFPPRYFGDVQRLAHDYLVDDYLADVGTVPLVGSVHIENGAADPIVEAHWLDDLSSTRGVPSVSVASLDFLAPDAAETLATLAEISTVRGVRYILNWHPDPYFSHTTMPHIMQLPRWQSSYRRLAEVGFSFDMQVFADQLDEARALAQAVPSVPMIINHAGMPLDKSPEGMQRWRSSMRALATLENVSVKISGLGTTDPEWSPESIRPVVLDTIDIFGPERTMFASNFPVDGLRTTFGGLYDSFDQITGELETGERAALFAGTARRVYRIAA